MTPVRPRIRTHLPVHRHAPDRAVDELDDRLASGRQPFGDVVGCPLDPGRRLLGDTRRRAVRERDPRHQAVGVDLGKEGKGSDPAAHKADGEEEQAKGDRQDAEPVVEGDIKRRSIDCLHEPLQVPVARPLGPRHRRHEEFQGREKEPEDREHETLVVRKVTGEDEERLAERHQQRRDEGKRHHGDELPHHPRHETEREERDHGREHARDHTRDHLDCAVDGGPLRPLPHPPVSVDVVADDDRIVDNDADRHQEGEHREHVERLVGEIHKHPGPEHRERDPGGDPEGSLEIEEQCEHDEHDQQPLETIGDEHLEPVANVDRLVGPHRKLIPLWQPYLIGVAADCSNHGEKILTGTAVDRDDHALAAVDTVGGGDVGKIIADYAEVANREHEPVGERDEGQLGDVLADVAFVLAAEKNLTPLAADRAAGEFEIFPADDVGHLLEREAVLPQRFLADFDVDLEVTGADEIRCRHSRQREEIVAHLLGHVAQAGFGHLLVAIGRDWRKHADFDGRRTKRHLLHLRILSELRQAGDPLHLGADLAEHLERVLDVLVELEDAVAHPLLGHARELLDPGDAPTGLLDLLADPLLHLIRRGTGIGDGHEDDFELKLGKRLAPHCGKSDAPDEKDRHHQRIHCRHVADGPADDTAHPQVPVAVRREG